MATGANWPCWRRPPKSSQPSRSVGLPAPILRNPNLTLTYQVHPSLEPLLNGGTSMEHLEHMIDGLFTFHDHTPPTLLVGGPLR